MEGEGLEEVDVFENVFLTPPTRGSGHINKRWVRTYISTQGLGNIRITPSDSIGQSYALFVREAIRVSSLK